MDNGWTNCPNCGKRLNEVGTYCDKYCEEEYRSGERVCKKMVVNSDEWVNGTWEHITWDPIKITGGKKELIEVCKRYKVAPKVLLKPKSQGRGFEIKE